MKLYSASTFQKQSDTYSYIHSCFFPSCTRPSIKKFQSFMAKFKGEPFNPETDIPDLSGQVIVVTGGNTGIGKKACLSLAKHNPSHLYILARNPKTADATIAEIKGIAPTANVTFIRCNLDSLTSVDRASREIVAQTERLDILICNAGILQPSGPPALTEDGYEVHFGTNHLGHALLTKILLPILLKTAEIHGDVRIISTSSDGYRFHPSGGIAFKDLRTAQKNLGILGSPYLSGWNRYFQSKLANIVYTTELARRYPSIKSIAIDPGIVDTELTPKWLKGPVMKRLLGDLKTPEEGSRNMLWAATAKNVESGQYYEPIGVIGFRTKKSEDKKLAKELWEWTEEQLKNYAT